MITRGEERPASRAERPASHSALVACQCLITPCTSSLCLTHPLLPMPHTVHCSPCFTQSISSMFCM